MNKNLKIFNCLVIFITLLSIQSSYCQQTCTYSDMQLNSTSSVSYSLIYHISDDKSSVYQTELDQYDNYKLFGYKIQLQNTSSTLSTEVFQFSAGIPIQFSIVYISFGGGCVLIDNSNQIIAFETSTLHFLQVQKINHNGYSSLRTNEKCNIIQIVDSSNNLKIYTNSNVQSQTIPIVDTVFDTTFTFGLDKANNLIKYLDASNQFTILKTFQNNQNLDIPLKVILKPATQVLILYSTNQVGDFSLVLYNYTTQSIIAQKNWKKASLNGSATLVCPEGDAFTSLIFKDQSGIVYVVAWGNGLMNQLGFYDNSLNQMFSGNAQISFEGNQIYSYLNGNLNVFNIYFPDQIYFLGGYQNVNFLQDTQIPINKPYTIQYRNFIGKSSCSNNSNNGTTNNTSNSTTNETSNNTSNNTNNQTNEENAIIDLINSNSGGSFYATDPQGNVIVCPTACISCTDGQTCNVCMIGYALNSQNQCIPCTGGCKKCSNTNSSFCLSCFLPDTLDLSTNTCVYIACADTSCQTCNSVGNCTSCFSGHSLWDGTCKACVTGCKSCTFNLTQCDPNSCSTGFVYVQNTFTNTTQCVACAGQCSSCSSSNLYSCIGCNSGYYPILDNTKTPPSNSCLACIQNCQICTDSVSCTTCSKGYQLTSTKTKCVSKCSSSCYTCEENLPNKCLSCVAGNTYDPVAKACNVDMTCNSTQSCVSCSTGYVLNNKQCFQCNISDPNCQNCLSSDINLCGACNPLFYLDATANMCKSCSTNCTSCFNENSCSQCASGSYLVTQNGQATGYCVACKSPCQTCYNDANTCSKCVSGYGLVGQKCKGKLTIDMSVQFNLALQLFSLISNTFSDYIVQICSSVSPIDSSSVIINSIIAGSTIVSTSINANPATASSMGSALNSQIASGIQIQGVGILSSSTIVSGLTTINGKNSSNIGLILGVSIPLFIIVVLMLVYFVIKKKGEIPIKEDSNGQTGKQSGAKINDLQDKYTQQI